MSAVLWDVVSMLAQCLRDLIVCEITSDGQLVVCVGLIAAEHGSWSADVCRVATLLRGIASAILSFNQLRFHTCSVTIRSVNDL